MPSLPDTLPLASVLDAEATTALLVTWQFARCFCRRLQPDRALVTPTLEQLQDGLCSGGEMDVPIPELGAESIVEGGILSIAKNVGDYVAAEEMVAEIETGALLPPPCSHTLVAMHAVHSHFFVLTHPLFRE